MSETGQTLEQMEMRAIILMNLYNYEVKSLALVAAGMEGTIAALRAEVERLTQRCKELVEQCNADYKPMKDQLDEAALTQAQTEYGYALEVERLAAERDALAAKLAWHKDDLPQQLMTVEVITEDAELRSDLLIDDKGTWLSSDKVLAWRHFEYPAWMLEETEDSQP